MNHSIARISLALLALLSFSSCESVSRAPEGSPRLELEVVLNVDPSFAGKLQGVGEDFTRQVSILVLSKADVGLRFYPVPSEHYKPKDARPEYLMTVQVRDLELALEHRTITKKDNEPVIESFVKHVECAVSTELTKRRMTGPTLTVGRSEGKGTAAVRIGEPESKEPSYTVKRDSATKTALTVTRTELLNAIGEALDRALLEVVASADRELQLRSNVAKPPAKPE